jgi:hypothetical protein
MKATGGSALHLSVRVGEHTHEQGWLVVQQPAQVRRPGDHRVDVADGAGSVRHAFGSLLYDKLPANRALIRFTEEEGADSHREPAAKDIHGERIFDWLDQHIPA